MPQPAPLPPTRTNLADARDHGRQIGGKANGLGVDCPYAFDIIELRHHWFAGFREGRARLRLVLTAD